MANKEFFAGLDELEMQKGISREDFLRALSEALVAAYRRQNKGDTGEVVIKLDPEKMTVRYYSVKHVVEEVIDPDKEISLEDAQAIKKSYKVGDDVSTEFVPKSFGRIPAGTARQLIMQKLGEIEKANTVSEFEDKEGELMACTVRRIEGNNVYVELGSNQIEGVLMQRDQVPGEKYEVNQKINVYVKKVKNFGKNTQIVVSRTCAGLVRKIFENEVPEIKQGLVTIKAIARDAGGRTKIAIASEDPSIDAVGACVGNKGARVNAIVSELGGEKIDIILWSDNPLEFISKALSPARVIKVIETGEKTAMAIVPDDKLSLAIGRGGQNARLAVKLTEWKIDVKSESQAIAELGEEATAGTDEIPEE